MHGHGLRFKILLLLLTPLLALLTEGQVKIHGKITDSEGKPVEFATVRIGGTIIGTTSGLEGDYSLSCPAADTIHIHFSCIGYREATRALIDAKGDVTLNMRLQLSTEMLQQVEVTELKKQTGSVGKIDATELRKSPDVQGGSVESLITTMAGVTGSNEMSAQYSVRGGSYDENSVYINGIEVYRPQLITSGQQEGLSIINPDLVGSIGFSTGGFPAEYGDKMSSVLDITYRQPQSFEGSLSASLMGGSLTVGQASGKFSQLHGIRYKRNSSLLGSMDTKGEYNPAFFDYQTSLTWQFSKKLKASFLGNIGLNQYKFTPQNRTTTFGTTADAKKFTVYFDGHEKDRFDTYFGALSLEYRINRGTNLQLLASGYLTDELVAYDISGEYWLDQAGTSDVGGELGVGRYHEHARNRLKASVLSLALKGQSALNPATPSPTASASKAKNHGPQPRMGAARLCRILTPRHRLGTPYGLQPRLPPRPQLHTPLGLRPGRMEAQHLRRLPHRQRRPAPQLLELQQRTAPQPAPQHRLHPRQSPIMGHPILHRTLLPVTVLQRIPHAGHR